MNDSHQAQHGQPVLIHAPQLTLPPSLRIAGCGGGFVLVDPRVHASAYFGRVATVTQRDPHPIHGGGIDDDEAHRRAQLFAAAEGLATAARDVLDLIDKLLADKNMAHEVEVLRAVLAQAMPDSQPIIQRKGAHHA